MKVDSYKIYDDLALVEDAITVHIVDALFTSVRQDWGVNDESDPRYIPNRPKKTSDFENDGSDGTSKYIEAKDINVDFSKLPTDIRVKINPATGFKSVVEDNVAKIDLSVLPDNLTIDFLGGYLSVKALKDNEGIITPEEIRGKVDKEYKTGSNTDYKSLTDNNYTDIEKDKLSKLIVDGSGDKALLNDGTYGVVCKIDTVNSIAPDEDKNVLIGAANILTEEGISVEDELNNKVSWEDEEIVLSYSKALKTNNSSGNARDLVKCGPNGVEIGDVNEATTIFTSQHLRVKHGDITEDLVYKSELEHGYVPFTPDGMYSLFNEFHNKINNKYIDTSFHRKLTYLGSWDAAKGSIMESSPDWIERDIQYGDILVIEVAGRLIPSTSNKKAVVEYYEELNVGDWIIYLEDWKHLNVSQQVISVNGKRGTVTLSLEDIGYKTPVLNTSSSESLVPAAKEHVENTINLHKISKTGKLKDAVDYNELNECIALSNIEEAVTTNESWVLPYSLIGVNKLRDGVSVIGSVSFTDEIFEGITDLVLEANVVSNNADRITMKMTVTSPSRMRVASSNTSRNTIYSWESIISVGKDDETADVVWIPVINIPINENNVEAYLNGAGRFVQIPHSSISGTGAANCHTIDAVQNLRNELTALSNRIARLEQS